MQVIVFIIGHKSAFVAPGTQASGLVISDDLVDNGLSLPFIFSGNAPDADIEQVSARAVDIVVIAQQAKKVVGGLGSQRVKRNGAFPAGNQVGIVADAGPILE